MNHITAFKEDNTMMNITNITTAYTHGGVFHADDVFATAVLNMINPDIEIKRVFRVPELAENEIAFDIGGGKFDHHDVADIECHEDDEHTPYAAFGLIWREYGHLLVSEMGFKTIEKDLVIPIDAADNGVRLNPMTVYIKNLNPSWDDETAENRFDEAVSFAEMIIRKFIEKAQSADRAYEVLINATTANQELYNLGILEFSKYIPWKYICTVENIPVKFAVYPSLRGGYNIESIDSEKFPLPEEWLAELPDGMTFCHRNRFIAATETKEQAIEYAKVAAKAFSD